MSGGIAILLKSDDSDLFPTLRAVELAKRTEQRLHAVFIEPEERDVRARAEGKEPSPAGEANSSESLKIAVWLGEIEGVKVSCHVLQGNFDRTLLVFLRTHNISCLVRGVGDEADYQKVSEWASSIRRRLSEDNLWYRKSFWVLITPTGENGVWERVLQHFGRQR